VIEVLPQLGLALDGVLVIDAANSVGGAGPLNHHDAVRAAAPNAVYARAFNTLGWENFAEPTIAGEAIDLFWAGADPANTRGGALAERLIADVGLRPVWVGGDDAVATVDNLTALWFALALKQGRGRRLAFRLLTP